MRLTLSRDLLLHLRIPFSLFLMPVFWFAISQSQHPDWGRAVAVFVILHLLIYPASNAYNSYYDRDEGPIGGLENPPPVDERLHRLAWALDGLALVLSYLLVGWVFAGAMLIYSAISKAYSNDRIRLKKYPVLSWLIVGMFQGAFTYLTVLQAVDQVPIHKLIHWQSVFPALLATFNLLGFYPMTQIYQHDEDARRGDLTMSRLLGIRGTFLFTGAVFGLVTGGFFWFLWAKTAFGIPLFALYLLCLTPVLFYFLGWLRQVWSDSRRADFRSTMKLNILGSLCLNAFFGLIAVSRFF
ncbi:MAG: UbiA family prenyltransferase [Cytophagaceae bacterium]|nr:UbiA family prenyltransferase [Cytophagaceae bacterium]